jgi:soluble calcium-activated nucleotidase 1
MDKKSKIDKENTWRAVLKEGRLVRDPNTRKYSITWTKEYELKSKYNEGGRGMELSELIYYNDKLLTCDDRTGIIFEITKEHVVVPRYITANGDGNRDKGFKVCRFFVSVLLTFTILSTEFVSTTNVQCEWMTVKDDLLWIGSLGKEWTNEKGIIENFDPAWVKTIDREGRIRHINWTDRYTFLRTQTNANYPGYLIHEAVGWNVVDREWVFLPRRKSEEAYNDILDEERGSNVMLIVSEDFDRIEVKTIGVLRPTHGFSSFKFVPWREHEIVALKTEEYQGAVATYIMVFDKETGEILMDETQFSNTTKFEGIEFI